MIFFCRVCFLLFFVLCLIVKENRDFFVRERGGVTGKGKKKRKKHNKSFPLWELILLGPYRDLTISHNIYSYIKAISLLSRTIRENKHITIPISSIQEVSVNQCKSTIIPLRWFNLSYVALRVRFHVYHPLMHISLPLTISFDPFPQLREKLSEELE